MRIGSYRFRLGGKNYLRTTKLRNTYINDKVAKGPKPLRTIKLEYNYNNAETVDRGPERQKPERSLVRRLTPRTGVPPETEVT